MYKEDVDINKRKQSEAHGSSSVSEEKHVGIVFVRAANYDSTPAIPRALEASKDVFNRVHILCWNRDKHPQSENPTIEGVTIKQFTHTAAQRSLKVVLLTLWYQCWLFWNLLRIKSDVIQVCGIVSGLTGGIVALLARRRLIYDMRDPFALCYRFPSFIRKIVYAVDWCVMGLSSAFVVPTSRYIPYLGHWAKSKREVFEIPNTCHDLLYQLPSVREILPPKKDGIIRLAYMGYLDASRGSRWLLDFCSDSSNRVELVAVGNCRSAELAAELQSTPNVTYIGRLPYNSALSVMREMDAVTIFCSPEKPSYSIADPTKFYDAMMVGTPVLISKNLSINQSVSDNKLGYSMEYGNMNDLRKAVENLRNPEEMRLLRTRCREYYLNNNLQLSKKLKHYREFYLRLKKKWYSNRAL